MEQLLHYVWKHRLFPLTQLTTTDGRLVEVLNPGIHNHDAGPDFFNAKVKIDGQLWVGNVEIHLRSSDWFRHHHDTDSAYDNVVLHVVAEADADVPWPHTADGQQSSCERLIPQLVLPIPPTVTDNYDRLAMSDTNPRCANVAGGLPSIVVHSFMSALQVERLEQRTEQVMERLKRLGGDWETVCFATVARAFGFGINTDAMEQWAFALSLNAAGKHRDDIMQVEALFFGQAGLLEQALTDAEAADYAPYYTRLRNEYKFLQHKFSLTPIEPTRWRFARMRPQNMPYMRLAQLAMLYHTGRLNMSEMIGRSSVDELRKIFDIPVSEHWQTHYSFRSKTTAAAQHKLSATSVESVIINAVVPLLFAYGRYKNMDELCDRSLEILDSLPAEDNKIVRAWKQCGVHAESAGDSQALIQLSRGYCDTNNCLRCRFGYEYLRQTPGFLKEEDEVSPRQQA